MTLGGRRVAVRRPRPRALWHMYRLLLPGEDEFRDQVVRAIEPQAAFTETATFVGRDLPVRPRVLRPGAAIAP